MKLELWTAPLLALVLAACNDLGQANSVTSGSASTVLEDEGEDQEEDIELDEVPELVMDALDEAFPGLALASAEKEIEDGETIYCLHGTLAGEFYEVEITAAG